MRRMTALMITALMVEAFVACSDDEQTSSTSPAQSTVAVDKQTTTSPTEPRTTPPNSFPARSTVTVTVTDVEGAVGYDLAGVLFDGDGSKLLDGIGGFGVVVDTDPFSTTQVVRASQPGLETESFRPESDWPYVTDEPLVLEPGTYHLQLWLGEWPLCCYSFPWVPADSPTLTGCGRTFTVMQGEPVTIAVGPPRSERGPGAACVDVDPHQSPATSVPPGSESLPLTNERYLDPVFDKVELTTVTFAEGLPDLVDGHPTALRLDIYEPVGDTAEHRPVIVWIHGGGFTGGSRRSHRDVATAYARLGYVTASVDYRTDPGNQCGAVRDRSIADPDVLVTETERCERTLQAAQDDVALAIAWLRSHATEYRIDSTRIAVGGFSAGAVTAINLAQRQNTDGLVPAESAVSAALAASGCNFDPKSIDATDTPISVLASGGEHLVPYTCVVETLDRAEAAGVTVQRLLYPTESAHADGLYEQHKADVDAAWREFLIINLDLD